MKFLWILASLIVLSGCSTSPDIMAESDAWKTYGYKQSLVGYYPIPQQTIAELSFENRKAYKEGYNIGRAEYCSYPAVLRRQYMDDYYGRICSRYQKF
ncbi:DUF2799 domain-containing protein [Thaumasiovibrio sp. DFM-14]|uniref:DUF2799 domain-containing protein n=1 Tax=Thaumasiovibrio sp. DFM-14 TaxID=3384792 RepID=UPI0039A16CEE